MEPSSAWDRAQQAIDRAERRDAAVVTPDNAVSPFDASATAVIRRPDLSGDDRDDSVTHRFAAQAGGTPGSTGSAAGRTPVVPPGAGTPSPRAAVEAGRTSVPVVVREEPPTAPVEVSDPGLEIVRDGDDGDDRDDADDDPETRPSTAPFAAGTDRPSGPAPRRSWWRRLFRRS